MLVSIERHPTLLPVPVGPVAVWTPSGVHGALHLGSARPALLDACRAQLAPEPGPPRSLSLTLNPWAGDAANHIVNLQLRQLRAADGPVLEALQNALQRGQSGSLSLAGSALEFEPFQAVDPFPLSVQASGVATHVAQFDPQHRTVLIVGSGVLAHRVVECLADTTVRVVWLALGAPVSLAAWPANAVLIESGDFVLGESPLPSGCHALVMTHDHDLDIDLCHRLLSQGAVQTLGMVGSLRKRAMLQAALMSRGVPQASIDGVRCPIGGGNHDNLEHASVAIAAELLAQR